MYAVSVCLLCNEEGACVRLCVCVWGGGGGIYLAGSIQRENLSILDPVFDLPYPQVINDLVTYVSSRSVTLGLHMSSRQSKSVRENDCYPRT